MNNRGGGVKYIDKCLFYCLLIVDSSIFFGLERAVFFLLSTNRKLIHSPSLVNRLFNIEPLDFHWSNWRSCE